MIKLVALGALVYAGYKYFQKSNNGGGVTERDAVAGGPLSDRATVQSTAEVS